MSNKTELQFLARLSNIADFLNSSAILVLLQNDDKVLVNAAAYNLLEMVDTLMDNNMFHGVQEIEAGLKHSEIIYLNRGDGYKKTLVFYNGIFSVEAWADIIERAPEQFDTDSHDGNEEEAVSALIPSNLSSTE